MKKILYLIRHAQAEDLSPMSNDFERELTTKGIMDAAKIGGYFILKGISPEYWVTSAANRTEMTTKVIMERLKLDTDLMESRKVLYSGGLQAYLQAINEAPASCTTMVLVGHNPEISYFAEYLTHGDFISMEKCGVIRIEFEHLEWAEISRRSGSFTQYFTPKTLYIQLEDESK